MPEQLWQPYNPAFLNDPYPFYRKLRNTDPIHKAPTGEWIISRYQDVKNALIGDNLTAGNRLDWIERSAEYLTDKDYDLKSIIEALNSFILMLNPPEHTIMRKFIASCWDFDLIRSDIQLSIAEIIDSSGDKEIDFVREIARPITSTTISKLLGLEYKEVLELQDESRSLVKSIDAYPSLRELVEMNSSAKRFIDFFSEKINTNAIEPWSVYGRIIHKNKIDKVLDQRQLISTGVFLFLAGTETTVASLSGGVKYFSCESLPHQYGNINAYVDELLRLSGPVHLLGRIASEDILLEEKVIPKNSVVTVLLASANRDELYFDKADEFNSERTTNRHLAFGQGKHYCLGDQLARLQLSTFWEKVLTDKLRFVTTGDLEYENNLSIRGIKKFPLKIERAGNQFHQRQN